MSKNLPKQAGTKTAPTKVRTTLVTRKTGTKKPTPKGKGRTLP